MFGKTGRRMFDLLVLLFALYGFAFVPLGRRTGLEHMRAILSTNEAEFAGDELKQAGGRLIEKFRGEDLKPKHQFKGEPIVPRLAPPSPGVTDSDEAPEP